jgi:hypothetical protein
VRRRVRRSKPHSDSSSITIRCTSEWKLFNSFSGVNDGYDVSCLKRLDALEALPDEVIVPRSCVQSRIFTFDIATGAGAKRGLGFQYLS